EIGMVSGGAAKEPVVYTVMPNDTLQKISQKFYGTSKRWKVIYDANKDVLKSPDKIYAGQVINIPQE
ncbi:MAG: LysM peptidoglycan-binding domain-containing protein, partial [Candidatus Omnitrophica bacterium]|nr:LysM peptidoglycan-binding domain-containing protein [Candidatus Omnitrophota bacterium]